MLKILCALGLTVLVGGCDIFESRACTLQLNWSITVTATDSLTDAPVTDGLRGFVREGSFQEDFARFASSNVLVFSTMDERAGTYEVVVNATGYREWRMSSVRVREDECHVQTRALQARMVPQP